jgi:hypothetical protein
MADLAHDAKIPHVRVYSSLWPVGVQVLRGDAEGAAEAIAACVAAEKRDQPEGRPFA